MMLDEPGGLIGVVSAETARYAAFSESLANLDRPPTSVIRYAIGSEREQGRNALVRECLEGDHPWLLFVDDDHVFGADLLRRLLTADRALIGALYFRRDPPYTPVAYSGQTSEGAWVPILLTRAMPRRLAVAAVGTGGMLIKREVFEAMSEPYFVKDDQSEDLTFCRYAQSLGFQPHVDVGTWMGHCAVAQVWPGVKDEEWSTNIVLGDVSLP